MGNAEYKNHVLGTYYDEVVGLNNISGTSYIATKTDNQWGLIKIKFNGKIECEWKLIADNSYNYLNEMLLEHNINQNDYIVEL